MQKRGATPAALGFRMPAEWEPHRATWLAWPHEPTDWPGKLATIPWVFAEIARQLARAELVRLIVASAGEERRARRVLEKAHVDLGRVEFFRSDTNRSWTRDSLPLFVVRKSGRKHEVAAVKFRFNAWARYPNHQKDERAGQRVGGWLGLREFRPTAALGKRREPVVLEGGAIDVDGQGTLLATEECLLSGQFARNPELGRERTERIFFDYLGVTKVIWLGRGVAGDDTTGHVDDFVRFVAPGKVVVCEEPNRRDANHSALAEARQRLSSMRDARGRKLEVQTLPMPAPLYYGGQRLPASYANFYVANGVVLVPTFNDPSDREALGRLAELFPGRRVVGIHAVDLVLGLGTLHCSTQQEPR